MKKALKHEKIKKMLNSNTNVVNHIDSPNYKSEMSGIAKLFESLFGQ